MHRNARLTPEGRRILCERIASGRPAAHVALEECTGIDWKDWRGITDEELSMEVIIDEGTIERDDGWPLPSGPNVGTVPEGRIYISSATITEYLEGYDPFEATLEIHSLVDDNGTVFFFFGCT